ncbi:hypothetical protein M3Y98_00570000 [Aphelenchoides besseyi]|nr:hypothetical protein M3Y98_00570000 [Aphelenchoides besseyi]KAI6193762.1 hypothetical protein M3Y96_01053100 [Aphelenchoides besseyi]
MRFGLLIVLGVLVCVVMPELGSAKRHRSLSERASDHAERVHKNVKHGHGHLPMMKRDLHRPKNQLDRHRTQNLIGDEDQASGDEEYAPRHDGKKAFYEQTHLNRQDAVTAGHAVHQTTADSHGSGSEATKKPNFFEKTAKHAMSGINNILGNEDEHHKESTAGHASSNKKQMVVDASGPSRPIVRRARRNHRRYSAKGRA